MNEILRVAQDDKKRRISKSKNIGVDPKVVCHFSGKPSTTRLNVVNRRSTPEGAKVNESIQSKEQHSKFL